jgi:hypothetical protein
VAVDSTGLESCHVSHYYGKRSGLRKTVYPKWTLVIDTRTHLVIGTVVDRGPRPDDIEFDRAVRGAHTRQPFSELLADAGYDSEEHHRMIREDLGARSIIPPLRGRPTAKPPTGHYRAMMHRHFPKKAYGQRWQVESAISSHKRRIGSALRARRYWTQWREVNLRAITHNLMLIAGE